MSTAICLFLGGVLVGHLAETYRQQRHWNRLAIQVFTQHPMSTTPPTLTELRRPDWMEDA